MRIAIVHYTYIPVIGGVEFIIAQHAALFTRHGHSVRVICGSGSSRSDDVSCVEIPSLLPDHPATAAAQEQALSPPGTASPAFSQLKSQLKTSLRSALDSCDVIFVHNIMTMHFNLAATAALWELADESPTSTRWVNWIHDLAALDPEYPAAALSHFPANLLARSHPRFAPVAISAKRQRQFCKLATLPHQDCPVIPNGIEFLRLLKLSKNVKELTRLFGILYQDVVLIHPTRILRRKNIEFGIRTLAALKATGHSCLYLVTGAPDPHNRSARDYGTHLRSLIADLDLSREFLFVSEHFPVSDRDLISLYSISDLLFLPSRQEGFGLPLLEAGLFRIPTFCTGIEPMDSILTHNTHFFELDDQPAAVADRILTTLAASPGYLARKEVMRLYSWDVLFQNQIGPMFLSSS